VSDSRAQSPPGQARVPWQKWLRVLAYAALFVVLVVVLTPHRPDSNGDPDAAAANNLDLMAALVGAAIVTGLAVLLVEAALRIFGRRN